jgi:hypothetical protein
MTIMDELGMLMTAPHEADLTVDFADFEQIKNIKGFLCV